jgi:hypothetical protein
LRRESDKDFYSGGGEELRQESVGYSPITAVGESVLAFSGTTITGITDGGWLGAARIVVAVAAADCCADSDFVVKMLLVSVGMALSSF